MIPKIPKRKPTYGIVSALAVLVCTIGYVFAYQTSVPTTLALSTPEHTIVYTPVFTWMYTNWPVYVEIVWEGILSNSVWIFHNGKHTFDVWRWTGPFITWAAYSSGNMRTLIHITKTINRIDDIWPIFAGVVDGATYTTPVTIIFSDDYSNTIYDTNFSDYNLRTTATLNGDPFTNGSTIYTNGTYQLIVTDAVGNTTWATFIVYLNDTPQGWWGWWWTPWLGARKLTEEQCKQRDCYSQYYIDLCGSCTPPKKPTLPGDWPPYHYANPLPPSIKNSTYPKERNDAYLRAYGLGITTVPNIEKSEMNAPLFRKFAAKMASEFALNTVGLIPDENKPCKFSDIRKETPELQYYIQLSCKLGIMGLDYYGDPDTVFNPNYVVTRDQLATILSRILFRNENNIKHDELTLQDKAKNFLNHSLWNISKALGINLHITTWLDWYTKHLEAIKKLWVMTDYNPTTKEFRWFVMIIMYRLDKMGITKANILTETGTDLLK